MIPRCRPPLIRIAILCCWIGTGLLLGAGSYTVYYADGTAYLKNDPAACVNCHIMNDHYDGWLKASHHAAATCNDCHVPEGGLSKWASKLDNGFWHSVRFTLQDFHEPIRIRPHNARILNQNCVRCHGELVSEIIHAPRGVGMDLDCVRCHAGVGHGPTR